MIRRREAMSIVYKKSISEKYQKYFENGNELIKPFMQYSIEDSRIIEAKEKQHSWDGGTAGVPIAWLKQEKVVVVDQTDVHTLVIGPTGSKKSRLIAMPMVRILGSNGIKESMIICDPKAEIFNRTAGFLKKQGYNIMTLNLRETEVGLGWNPLTIPYSLFCMGEIDRSYEFVNDIAENLIKDGLSSSEPFWDNSAGSLFFGLTVLLFKYCTEQGKSADCVNIGNVIQLRNTLFSSSSGGKNSRLWKYAKQDPIIAASLIGTVETAKETQGGILSTFDQKLRIFSMQPGLLNLLSHNEIDLNIVGNAPTVVFMIVPDEKTGYHKLVSLFVKQSYEYIIFKAQEQRSAGELGAGRLRNRVNYILDEFSSLPVINDFPAMVTASRSRNIRFTLFIQSKHQLVQRYKDEAETILTNCGNWIFLTSREPEILQEISTLCGKVNAQIPVLSEAELQRLDKASGEALLLSGRSKPFITHLPDISLYEKPTSMGEIKKIPEVLPKSLRAKKSIEFLDFEIPYSKEEIEQLENQQKQRQKMIEQLKAIGVSEPRLKFPFADIDISLKNNDTDK